MSDSGGRLHWIVGGYRKIRGIAGDVAWSMVEQVLALGASFVSFILLGRELGVVGYGLYASMYALIGPLSGLSYSGIMLAVLQHVVRNREDPTAVAASTLSWSLLLGGIVGAAGLLLSRVVVADLSIWIVLAFIVSEMIAVPLIDIASAMLQSCIGYAAAVRIRIIPLITKIVVIIALALFGALELRWLALVNVIVVFLVAFAALAYSGHRLGIRLRPGAMQRQHLKTGLTFSSAIVTSSLTNDGDKVVMSSYGYRVDVGLYNAAYRVLGFASMPLWALVASTHQRFLEHDDGARSQHVRRSLKFSIPAASYAFLVAVVMFFAAPQLKFLLGDEFSDAIPMVRALAPMLMLRAMSAFALNGLMGLGRTGVQAAINIASAVLSMSLYLVFIPLWGWKGAVVATLIVEVVLAITTWTMLIRLERKHDREADAQRAAADSAADTDATAPAVI
ncbi:MAG: lipopolysaccharide biosynthesis protein [Acidimicrobiia bacterium]